MNAINPARRAMIETDTRIADAYADMAQKTNRVITLRHQIDNLRSIARIDALREDLDTAKAEMRASRTKLTAAETEYEGWSRFFLVKNDGGHIHRSMNRSTCRPTTQFAWLVELAGLTEADAVEANGGILCTVCYPSAPVEHTNGTNKLDAAEKAAKANARAVAKLPEYKPWKRKKDLVERHTYNLRMYRQRIEHAEADIERAANPSPDAEDRMIDLANASAERDLPKLGAEVEATARKLSKAETALSDLAEALADAIAAAGLEPTGKLR